MSTYEQFANDTLPNIVNILKAHNDYIKILNNTIMQQNLYIIELNNKINKITVTLIIIGICLAVIGVSYLFTKYSVNIKRRIDIKMNKIIILIVIISSIFIPVINAKTVDDTKHIGSNSTTGLIGFSPDLSVTSIELNKTDGMIILKGANLDGNYTWINIGFNNINSSNLMIINTLKENHVGYNSTINNSHQRIWVLGKGIPISVTGGSFIWSGLTNIVNIINSGVDVLINWSTSGVHATIALPIFIFTIITLMVICLRLAIRR